MSVSSALNNAVTGLNAASRAAELVSSNVANALTPGYGRRELELSARAAGTRGAGVQVDGVTRIVDQALLADRRRTQADVAGADISQRFFTDLQNLIGLPEEAGSLNARIDALESALITAASRPDLAPRLQAVLDRAEDLTNALTNASKGVQGLRERADSDISRSVDVLNANLGRLAELNAEIVQNSGAGRDPSALLDQRQVLIDRVSELVPLRLFERENGAVAIYSEGGALLLDTKPAKITFTQSPTITPYQSIETGTLSAISINGDLIIGTGTNAPLAGGQLAALFETRDVTAPQAQARLDAIARDLIERVAGPAVDATLSPGDAGFFTDAGLPFDPIDEIGLSQRIVSNPALDPASGGDLWRLRDGIAATAEGPVGNNTALRGLTEALQAARIPASGDISAAARSAAALAGDFISLIGTDLTQAEGETGFANAQLRAMRDAELGAGVDTDREMQKLLLIEQAYAANARVITTADEMIDLLLGI